MEKIREAVDRARQSAVQRRPVPAAARPVRPGGGQHGEHIDVSYSQTRVVQLDPVVLEENRIIASHNALPAAHGFDILRTQVLQLMTKNNWKTVAITSPTPECGKTVVSINLAFSLARQTDRTVLLADLDLRKPSVARYLGLPAGPSVTDVLNGRAAMSDALINPGIPRVVVLPNYQPTSNASEILTTRRMKELVIELRERYEARLVVFDLPPVLATDDALAFCPQVDCVLLVVGVGACSVADVNESQRMLQSANLLGVVLNKAEGAQPGYYSPGGFAD